MFDAVELHKNKYYYKYIEQFYGDKSAQRSGVRYMNHIDEGIAVLDFLCAPGEAIEAYCLHPMFQCDDDLKENLKNKTLMSVMDKITLVHVIEYRNKANNFLSPHVSKREPSLSPLVIVNWMLLADKIQNYKDFLKYQSHPEMSSNPTMPKKKWDDLDQYFQRWLAVLVPHFQFDFAGEIEQAWKLIDSDNLPELLSA